MADDPIVTIEDLEQSLGRIEYALEQMERRNAMASLLLALLIIAVLLFR